MLNQMNPKNLTYIVGLFFILNVGVIQAHAASEDQPPVIMALWAQEWELDQQITDFEQRIADVRQRSIDFQATSLVVARLEPQDQLVIDDESEVPLLDEYTVQDTYLDPFDDENTEEIEDPWEDFNSSVFDFNLNLDRNFVSPVAKGYHYIMPDFAERALGNAFSNVRVLPRLVNNLFQGKVQQAGVVLGRFFINSTLGVAGFFDVAQTQFGIESPAEEDAGQTLAVLGVQPGPYLVLPLLPPMTVRDGVGNLADLVLDPLNYLLPFVAQASTRVGETVSDRAQNLDTFEGIEDSTLDLYAAVRDGYIQTRAQAIQN